MRILIAVDQQPEMAFVVNQAAKLAGNTWANVTLLGICRSDSEVDELARRLDAYRNMITSLIEGEISPYARQNVPYKMIQEQKGVWIQQYDVESGRKDLSFRIRCGNAGKAIIAESQEADADLIIIGCGNGSKCEWPDDAIRKVVRNAMCSVLVIKEEKEPQMLVCCLDQDTVSQASIELINQLVTLYGVDLEIVGVNGAQGLSAGVDRRMAQILAYYTNRNIRAWIKSVDSDALKAFVSQAADKNLVALWVGKESFLSRIFSRQRLVDLTAEAESSILILR